MNRLSPHHAFLTAVGVAALIAAGPALGQTTQAQPADASNDPSQSDIIVTATKQSSPARETAASITAFSGKDLDALGAQSFADYLTRTPGVVFNAGIPGNSSVTIRGVATTNFFDQGQGTTGYYINDVPLTDPNFAIGVPDIDAFDVDTIAILRGPQGTLFGSASLGGAVNYQAARPNLKDVSGRLQGTVAGATSGEIGGSIKGMINVPIIADKLAVRAVGIYRKDGGYIDNIGAGQTDANSIVTQGGRVQVLWSPTPDLSINYLFLYQQQNSRDLGFQEPATSGQLKKNTRFLEPFNFTTMINNLRVDYDFGPATLTALGTLKRKEQFGRQDVTSFFGAYLPGVSPLSSTQRPVLNGETFEVRLASAPGHRLEYLLGFMYDNSREAYTFNYYGAGAAQSIQTAYGFFGPTVGQTVAPGDVFENSVQHFNGQEIAGFGEVSYNVSDKLKLTVGGRVFSTKLDTNASGQGLVELLTAGSSAPVVNVGTQKSSDFLPKGSVTWRPSKDVMIYGLVSEGFRFGGPNTTPGVPTKSYGSDSLVNYELGTRLNLFDRKWALDLTAFYIDWSDIQLRLFTPGGLAYGANAGKAKNYGFEVSSNAKLTNSLSLQTGLTHLIAKLDQDFNPGAGQPIIAKGTQLAGAAKWQVSNTLSYDWKSGPLAPVLAVSQRYISGFPGAIGQNAPAGDYVLVDARATVHAGKFDISAFVNNIGDSHGVTAAQQSITLQQFVVRPRTYGLTLDVGF